jgi:hypothetical protein
MSSTGILIVEKNGNIKPLMWKKFVEEEIYKKAGFKRSEGFKLQTTYKTEKFKNNKLNNNYIIDVYGKTEGRANQENKYEFPPPIAEVLFFGSCILISRDSDNNAKTLKEDEWENIYDLLHGGFEDLGDGGDSEEEEEDNELPRTSTGYVKDDFVVDDGEFGDDDYLECSSELSEDEFI